MSVGPFNTGPPCNVDGPLVSGDLELELARSALFDREVNILYVDITRLIMRIVHANYFTFVLSL